MTKPEDWRNAKRIGGGGRTARRMAATGRAKVSPAVGSYFNSKAPSPPVIDDGIWSIGGDIGDFSGYDTGVLGVTGGLTNAPLISMLGINNSSKILFMHTFTDTPADGVTGLTLTIDGAPHEAPMVWDEVELRYEVDLEGTDRVELGSYIQSNVGNDLAVYSTKTPDLGDLIPTTDLTSYTFDTDAWTLSAAAPIGEYYLGEPFMISDSSTSFTAMGLASGDIDGFIANGVHSNPYFNATAGSQGMDAMWGNSSNGESVPYDAGLNVDPTQSGAYAVAVAAEETLVKGGRRAGSTVATFGMLNRIDAMTIVPSANHPNVGAFRPPMCGTDKASFINVSDIHRGCCLSVDVSSLIGVNSSHPRSYAEVLADWRNPITSFGVTSGEGRRTIEVLTNVSATNYAAELSSLIWETGVHLHSSALNTADWTALAAQVVQAAIDMTGAVEAGLVGQAGEGQHHFYFAILFWGAALTGNSRINAAAQSLRSNIDQPLRCAAEEVGQFTQWPAGNQGGEFQYVQPQYSEDVGKPIWAAGGNSDSGTTSILQRTYLGTSGKGRLDEMTPLLAIQANKLARGSTLIAQGEPTREAMIQMLYRERAQFPYSGDAGVDPDSGYVAEGTVNVMDFMSPYWGVAAETTWAPDMPLSFVATAGAASVTWDYAAIQTSGWGSQTPLTGFEVRVSQWTPVQPVTVSTSTAGSTPALPGILTYASARAQNANGWSAWSHVDKRAVSSSAAQNSVTPTGAPSGAVANATLPALMVKQYPANSAALFTAATNDLALGTPYYLGAGIWTGAVTGDPTYAVEVNTGSGFGPGAGSVTTDDAGAPYYVPLAAEALGSIRVAVTVNGVTATSAEIVMGDLTPLPAGTFVDTDFGSVYPVQYADMNAATSVDDCDLVHAPFTGWADLDASLGAIVGDKTSSRNKVFLPLHEWPGNTGTGNLPAGTYDITLKTVVGMNATGGEQYWNAGGRVRISSDATVDDILYEETFNDPVSDVPFVFEFTHSYVHAADGPLWLSVNNTTGTGGSSGGDVVITDLLITGPVLFTYFDDFTTDTSANYTAETGYTITYNGADDTLDLEDVGGTFEGVLTAEIPVVSGQTYTVSITCTGGGGDADCQARAGILGDPGDYGSMPVDRWDTGDAFPVTYTFPANPTSSAMIINILMRGDNLGAILKINEIKVEPA